MQPSFCPRKDCKLYGTGRIKNRNCACNKFPNPPKQPCNENNYELDIEVYEKPKFL